MKNKLYNILFEKVDSKGLGVFRIFYSSILFLEIVQLFSYRKIVYDVIPYQDSGELTVSYIFLFWFFIVLALLIGFYTRFFAIINYILSVVIFSSAAAFEYHVFYAYVGINLLLIFMPIGKSLSIDNLISKLKYSNLQKQFRPSEKVYAANYLIPVFVGVGLVYFDSILYKFTSPMWLKGLGMWLPANLPMATWTDSTWLMNNELLVKFLGYLVICFETVFIFTFWFKSLRWPFVCIGLFFHIGILIEFPIPWFALCAVALYILLIPSSFWAKISGFLKFNKPFYVFLYDAECPLCSKTIIIINHFDVFNCISCETVQESASKYKKLEMYSQDDLLLNIHGIQNNKVLIGYDAYSQLFKSFIYAYPIGLLMSLPGLSNVGKIIYKKIAGNRITERCTEDNCPFPKYTEPLKVHEDILIKGFNLDYISRSFWKSIIILVITGQLIVSWFSPLVQNTMKSANAETSFVNRGIGKLYETTKRPLLKFMGITKHPVFMDSHFDGYNHIFKVEIRSNDEYKNIGLLNENGMPGKHIRGAFWVNYTFRVSSAKLDKTKLEKGLKKYFALSRNQNENVIFKISVKEIEIAKDWEKDFLHNQIKKNWSIAGSYNNRSGFDWTEEMNDLFIKEAN